jgi:hypothetical protein
MAAAEASPYIEPVATLSGVVIGVTVTTVTQVILNRQQRAADREARKEVTAREAQARRHNDMRRVYVNAFELHAQADSALDKLTRHCEAIDPSDDSGEATNRASDYNERVSLIEAVDEISEQFGIWFAELKAEAPMDTYKVYGDAALCLARFVERAYDDVKGHYSAEDEEIERFRFLCAHFITLARRDLGHPDIELMANQ